MRWNYSLTVSEAVSLSFHAANIRLSPGAQLSVTGGGFTYIYRTKDVHHRELWSRIAPGNRLAFQLRVPVVEAASVYLSIDSVQAGYRSLDRRGPNHPHYDRLRQRTAVVGAAAASCQENFACDATAANQGVAQATVALVIGNQLQCTGVLLNDVPQDGKPYVLTARHCENGNPDGGNPGAASAIVVYWDALSPCGVPLGTIYDPGIVVQFSAVTVVEQQDAWLVKLDQPPAVADAYFAGWDATGAAFVGGFTVHHGLGTTKQFVAWYGQASFELVPAASLGVHYDSTFWGTVNQLGSVNPGASGSGLFDPNDRLVGVVVRAKEQNSQGVCPVNPPATPTTQTETTVSTALSGIFSSTADPVSTTGATTIESVLDPTATGQLVLDGAGAPPYVTLFLTTSSPVNTGLSVELIWSAPSDTTCTASGGEAGDGWSGPLPASGSRWVTSYDGGLLEYVVSCTRGSRTGSASIQIDWQLSTPWVDLYVNSWPNGVNTPFTLSWAGNVGPCTGSGGAAGNGWNGARPGVHGSAQVIEPASGTFTYTITCGSGTRVVSAEQVLTVDPSYTLLYADADNLRVGQSVLVQWATAGQPCQATGGASGDGWAGLQIGTNGSLMVTESAAGTYVYNLSCGPASDQATTQLTLTFSAAAPMVTFSASPSQSQVVQGITTLSWNSNVRPCSLAVTGDEPGSIYSDGRPQSSAIDGRELIGNYVYTITCGVGAETATASLNFTYTGTPAVSFLNSMGTILAGDVNSILYLTNIIPCIATGGSAGDGWAGTYTARDQFIYVTETQAGTYTYTLTCGGGSQTGQAQLTVVVVGTRPAVTLSVDNASPLYGQPIVLTWASNEPSCTASGGRPGDGWVGTLPGTGSATVIETTTGDVGFYIDCGTPISASANVRVTYASFPAPDLRASTTNATTGQPITLTWQSSNGDACQASMGLPGDGWAGDLPAAGSVQVIENVVGGVFYQLHCGFSYYSSILVIFQPPPVEPPPLPVAVQLMASPGSLAVGQAATLTWAVQNADTCTAGGGGSGDRWQGNLSAAGGSQQVVETKAGDYTFNITCTAGSANAAAQASVTYSAAPSGSGSGGGGGGAFSWLELLLLSIYGCLVRTGTRK